MRFLRIAEFRICECRPGEARPLRATQSFQSATFQREIRREIPKQRLKLVPARISRKLDKPSHQLSQGRQPGMPQTGEPARIATGAAGADGVGVVEGVAMAAATAANAVP